jgi:hypothetical protein
MSFHDRDFAETSSMKLLRVVAKSEGRQFPMARQNFKPSLRPFVPPIPYMNFRPQHPLASQFQERPKVHFDANEMSAAKPQLTPPISTLALTAGFAQELGQRE